MSTASNETTTARAAVAEIEAQVAQLDAKLFEARAELLKLSAGRLIGRDQLEFFNLNRDIEAFERTQKEIAPQLDAARAKLAEAERVEALAALEAIEAEVAKDPARIIAAVEKLDREVRGAVRAMNERTARGEQLAQVAGVALANRPAWWAPAVVAFRDLSAELRGLEVGDRMIRRDVFLLNLSERVQRYRDASEEAEREQARRAAEENDRRRRERGDAAALAGLSPEEQHARKLDIFDALVTEHHARFPGFDIDATRRLVASTDANPFGFGVNPYEVAAPEAA